MNLVRTSARTGALFFYPRVLLFIHAQAGEEQRIHSRRIMVERRAIMPLTQAQHAMFAVKVLAMQDAHGGEI